MSSAFKSGQAPFVRDPQPDPANLSHEEMSSNQQATVIPWFCGTRKIAARWISPIYGLHAVDSTGAPSGFTQVADKYVFGASTKAIDSKANPSHTVRSYYGSVAGVICWGPVDVLHAVLINGGTVWPTNKLWADGVVNLATIARKRTGGLARLDFAVTHGLRKGCKFIVSGLDDASFNEASPTTIVDAANTRIIYANAGANVALTSDVNGVITKIIHYDIGDLVRDGTSIWQCILAHDGTPDKRPPNATYWVEYFTSRGASANPFAFTIPGMGTGYLYWGSDTQVLDTVNEKILSQNGHPPYRRQAVVVLDDFLFGQKSTAVNLEVIVSRAANQSAIVSGAAALDADWQANPLCAIAELLTDEIVGIGQDAAIIDAASWTDVADDLSSQDGLTYVSPFIDQAMTFRAFVALALAYFDGFMHFDATGTILAGRRLHGEAPPAFTSATTIDFNDLTQEAQFDSDLWAATFNETTVKFQDRMAAFKDAPRRYVSSFNRQVVGQPRTTSLDRPWITREDQAALQAAEWGKILAQQKLSGTLTVRAEKAVSIAPGSLFLLTHDAIQLSIICRCIEKTFAAPPSGAVTLKFDSERGIAALPFAPTGSQRIGPLLPGIEVIDRFQFVQLPAALSEDSFQLAVLCARASDMLVGLRLWMLKDDLANFQELGAQTNFAVAGLLHQNLVINTTTNDDDTENLQIDFDELTVDGDLNLVFETQTDDSINNDSLLVFILKASDPTQFEIMTLKAIRLNAGTNKLKVRRGRFGTAQTAFTTGDFAYIMRRADLVTYRHRQFALYAASGEAVTFRLQGFTKFEESDLSDSAQCPDINFTFADIQRPTIQWNVAERSAPGFGGAYVGIDDVAQGVFPYPAATLYRVGFQADALSEVIVRIEIVAHLGSRQVVIASRQIETQKSATLHSQPFQFSSDGVWEIYGVVTEESGRVTMKLIDVGFGPGSGIVSVGPTTKCQAPFVGNLADVYAPAGGGFPSDVTVGMAAMETGGSVRYSLTGSGASGPGAWTAAPGGGLVIPVGFPGQGSGHSERWTLWVQSQKGGKTDSEILRYEFWYKAP